MGRERAGCDIQAEKSENRFSRQKMVLSHDTQRCTPLYCLARHSIARSSGPALDPWYTTTGLQPSTALTSLSPNLRGPGSGACQGKTQPPTPTAPKSGHTRETPSCTKAVGLSSPSPSRPNPSRAARAPPWPRRGGAPLGPWGSCAPPAPARPRGPPYPPPAAPRASP
jgi:hypothetical protein